MNVRDQFCNLVLTFSGFFAGAAVVSALTAPSLCLVAVTDMSIAVLLSVLPLLFLRKNRVRLVPLKVGVGMTVFLLVFIAGGAHVVHIENTVASSAAFAFGENGCPSEGLRYTDAPTGWSVAVHGPDERTATVVYSYEGMDSEMETISGEEYQGLGRIPSLGLNGLLRKVFYSRNPRMQSVDVTCLGM